jgi:ferredoxin-NADP reductase
MELSEYRVRLQAIRYGAEDIALYELQTLDAQPLPAVSAGAHVDVSLPNGLIRQYSLVTPLCDASRYVLGIKREANGRGGSQWLHDSAKVGMSLQISAPRNHFALSAKQSPVVLLAGGIGITPIYSMLHNLRAQGRAVHLHYWCRSAEHALFRDTLEGCADVSLHYSQDAAGPGFGLDDALADLPADAEVYCCGPQRMIDTLDQRTPALGAARVHVERFQAAQAPTTADQAFTVVLARSGSEVSVTPGETILQALLDAGADVMYSCEQGICGACEVKVIDGQPVHCDTVRSADEHSRRNSMMICCSSSASARLVLDI